MHELYELKDKLCEELEKYGGQELSAGTLEVVDKLAHALKNLDKIIKSKEEKEYSNTYPYGRDGSYARGRGRNAKRDSMGRYASDGGYSGHDYMVDELYGMMNEAPDERTRKEIEKLAHKIEMM